MSLTKICFVFAMLIAQLSMFQATQGNDGSGAGAPPDDKARCEGKDCAVEEPKVGDAAGSGNHTNGSGYRLASCFYLYPIMIPLLAYNAFK